MNTFASCRKAVLWPVLVTLCTAQAFALSIRDFRRFKQEEQAMILTASVSMLVSTYAADGKTAQARCIRSWYFGLNDGKAHGPRDLATEITLAERADPDKFQIEGIILGITDRVCLVGEPRP